MVFTDDNESKRKARRQAMALPCMRVSGFHGSPKAMATFCRNRDSSLVGESSCSAGGWKGFSDEVATPCKVTPVRSLRLRLSKLTAAIPWKVYPSDRN